MRGPEGVPSRRLATTSLSPELRCRFSLERSAAATLGCTGSLESMIYDPHPTLFGVQAAELAAVSPAVAVESGVLARGSVQERLIRMS